MLERIEALGKPVFITEIGVPSRDDELGTPSSDEAASLVHRWIGGSRRTGRRTCSRC